MLGIANDLNWRSPAVWWPEGTTLALDFVNWRFMRSDVAAEARDAFVFLRPTTAWDDHVNELAADMPRRHAGGVLLEEARQLLSSYPATLANWSYLSGMPVVTALPQIAPFSPVRVASDGNIFARINSGQQSLASGQHVSLRVRYRAGSSGRLGIYMRDDTSGAQSILDGPAGDIAIQSSSAGAWSNLVNTPLGQGIHEVTATITVNTTSSGWRMGLSPRSTVIGGDVDILGAMNEARDHAGNWMLGAASQPGEQLVLRLPPGDQNLQIWLAGGSQRTVPDARGDYAVTADGLGLAGQRLVVAGIVARPV